MSRAGQYFIRLLAVCAFAAAVPIAHAGEARPAMQCPGNAGEPLPPRAEMSALAARLADLEAACGNDAGYLAYRGALLVELGNPEAASALLERALLLAPDHAGAQADYARALALLGDAKSAASLVDTLLARDDVPAGMQARLQEWQKFLGDDLTAQEWQTGGSLTLRAGGETNLNSAPTRSSLVLTLPEGPLALPLGDSYRAKGGAATMVEATLQAGRNLANGRRLQLLADIRARQAPEVAETNYRQYELLSVLTAPDAANERPFAANQYSLGLSRLEYGGERLYEAERFGLARIYQQGNCLLGGSADGEIRRYPAAANLDGRFIGLGGSLRCPMGDGRISLLGRIGADRATKAGRPGGDQRRFDLRLGYGRPLAGGRLEAEFNLSRQVDGAPYSDLLAHGAKRHLTRAGLRAEWSKRMSAAVEGVATLESSRQASNIALFDIGSTALWLGVRWNWGKGI